MQASFRQGIGVQSIGTSRWRFTDDTAATTCAADSVAAASTAQGNLAAASGAQPEAAAPTQPATTAGH